MRLRVDEYKVRCYTNAFIEYIEGTGTHLTMLECSLLDWLSDDDVKEFAEAYYDIEWVTEEEIEDNEE